MIKITNTETQTKRLEEVAKDVDVHDLIQRAATDQAVVQALCNYRTSSPADRDNGAPVIDTIYMVLRRGHNVENLATLAFVAQALAEEHGFARICDYHSINEDDSNGNGCMRRVLMCQGLPSASMCDGFDNRCSKYSSRTSEAKK